MISIVMAIIMPMISFSYDMNQDPVDIRVESSFYKYFERKNNIGQDAMDKSSEYQEYIEREMGRERRVMDYVKINPNIVIGRSLSKKYSINTKRIKIKHLVNLLSSLGAKIYMGPNSSNGDVVIERMVKNGATVKEIGVDIATRYGAGIKYYKTSGIYVVD